MVSGSGQHSASATHVSRLEPAYERKEKETPKSKGVVPNQISRIGTPHSAPVTGGATTLDTYVVNLAST